MAVNIASSRYDTLFDYLNSKICRRLPYQSNQRIKASGTHIILNKYVLSGPISIDLTTQTNFGALAARLKTDVGTPSTKALRDGFGTVINLLELKDDSDQAIIVDGKIVYGLLQAGMNKVDGTEVDNDVQITFIDENLNSVSIDEMFIRFSVVIIYNQRWRYNVEMTGGGNSEEAVPYEDNGHFWVGEEVPTLDNYPANKWTSEVVRSNHKNDIFYQMKGNEKVASYKFTDSPYWRWVRVSDQEVEELKKESEEIKNLAQSKMKVFVNQPEPPYRVGDLWLNDKELMQCINSRLDGEFVSTDWEKATKYTDDTKVDEVVINLNETNKELESVKTTVIINSTTIKDTVATVDGLKGEIKFAVSELEVQQIQINQKIGYDEAEALIEETAPIILQIISSNGNIFKNGQIQTTLEVTVWKQNRNITALFDDSDFYWTRVSSDPVADEMWNALPEHQNTKTIEVDKEDVYARATFNCNLTN